MKIEEIIHSISLYQTHVCLHCRICNNSSFGRLRFGLKARISQTDRQTDKQTQWGIEATTRSLKRKKVSLSGKHSYVKIEEIIHSINLYQTPVCLHCNKCNNSSFGRCLRLRFGLKARISWLIPDIHPHFTEAIMYYNNASICKSQCSYRFL